MNNHVDFSLSVYQSLFQRTEEAITLCVKTLPRVAEGNFTNGYLRGLIFHWWQVADGSGLPASVIDNEERHLRKRVGLPEEDDQP